MLFAALKDQTHESKFLVSPADDCRDVCAYTDSDTVRVSDTAPIRIRSRYGAGAYRIRHVAYPIILFSLTNKFGHRYVSLLHVTSSDTF
jgi:hypothetical protein